MLLAGLCMADNSAVCAKKTDKIVLAYVTSWSKTVPDPALVTHINYAFGHVNNTFDGVRIDNESRLSEIAALKHQKPTLKIMLSIGGWGSGRFSEMAADPAKRQRFAADCKRVLTQFDLDGIDIDWEFPTSAMAKISASPADTDNFTLLMRDIRKAIGRRKLLTLASNASAKYINFRDINQYVNFVNIMSYDMGGAPKHHSALYRSENTGWMCADEAVDAHIDAGIAPKKLTLGLPFYGRGTKEIGNFLDFKRIKNIAENYTEKWDDVSKTPYMVNAEGTIVLSYENVRSIEIKCKYLHDRGLLGAMYWDYDGDDDSNTLRKAVYDNVMQPVQ